MANNVARLSPLRRRLDGLSWPDRAFALVAFAVTLSVGVAAVHDMSKAWDVWFYHLPFAARIAGIVDPRAYVFGVGNQHRFEGFPLLGEALQGLVWKVTGRPECTNLVAFSTLPLFAWSLRRMFGVPAHATLLALLAIPLVQIHATSAYVDLPANGWLTLLLLLTHRAIVEREPPKPGTLAVAAVLAIAVANTKFQLVPLVICASLVLTWRALAPGEDRPLRALVVVAALPFVFATPLKNFVLWGNPVWPVEIHLPGMNVPFVETAYASSPRWLEHVPRPIRFACSVLELGARPIVEGHRWSLDQWTPPDEPGYRMGGFFGAYVALNLGAFVAAILRRRTRENVIAGSFFAAVTLLVGVMPQSHELRYYMVWMLLLVSFNLKLWARERPLLVGLGSTLALVVVVASTGGTYVLPSGDPFETVRDTHVDRRTLDGIAPGERVCVAREPWTFLWAARFHPGKAPWIVQEAEEPADCRGARPLD